jgi:hypothetical protein
MLLYTCGVLRPLHFRRFWETRFVHHATDARHHMKKIFSSVYGMTWCSGQQVLSIQNNFVETCVQSINIYALTYFLDSVYTDFQTKCFYFRIFFLPFRVTQLISSFSGCVIFQVHMAVSKKITYFLEVMKCSFVYVYLSFGWAYYLCLHGRRVSLVFYADAAHSSTLQM